MRGLHDKIPGIERCALLAIFALLCKGATLTGSPSAASGLPLAAYMHFGKVNLMNPVNP